jgi:Domain of unknown function (DUF6795)
MALRRMLLAILSGLAAGCVPLPHMQYDASAFSGVVTRAGTPVAGASIRVSTRYSKVTRETSTNQDGRFSTKPIREFQFFAVLLGDPISNYSLEITLDGQTYRGYAGGHMGFPPKQLSVICDLNSPPDPSGRLGYCEAQIPR